MDVLESVLERIAACQGHREAYLRQVDAEDQKIAKLEQVFYLLDDPATEALMRDMLVGLAVQNGAPVPNGNGGAGSGEKHYVGMQSVREYVAAMQSLTRACLAAIARRAGVSLVVTYEEIEREYRTDAGLALASDADAKCVRITVPEVRE